MNPLRILEEALFQQVSAINARVVIERSRRTLRDPNHLTTEDRARFLITVRSTLRLFSSDDRTTAIVEDLEKRLDSQPPPASQESLTFTMRNESDLRVARARTRDVCLALPVSSTDAQRVATAVSELGRNIISYTPGGQIVLQARRGPPASVRLVATDAGHGIAQIADVLAGTYRSKTGLGRGLLGVKRLMDEFHVETGEQGTRIETEVKFSC